MHLLKLFTLLSTSLLLSSVASATLTYNAIGGASYVDVTTTPTKPIIYGGFAGTCSGGDNSTTCNTCQSLTALTPCNKQAVYDGLNLVITLNTDQTIGSKSDITAKMDSTNVNLVNAVIGSGSITLYITWQELCRANNGESSCATAINRDLVISAASTTSGSTAATYTVHVTSSFAGAGTDTYTDCPDTTTVANQGVCHFTAFPGDSKVYADDLGYTTGYPTSQAGVNFSSLVFFYEAQTAADANNDDTTRGRITPQSASYEMPVNSSNSSNPLVDRRITGLSNNTKYCFVMANKDLTGNIYFYTPASVTSDTLCATPEPVAGLLDDKHCFIATAAFGSDMAPEVQSFRDFRNRFLLTNDWGRNFVKTYYKYSPKYANMIAQSETAKTVVRAGLWPLLFFARMSVAFGFWISLAIMIFASLTIWGLYRRLILGKNVRGEL